MALRTLQVKQETKERFQKLGNVSDTQDTVLLKLLEFYDKYSVRVEKLEQDNKQMREQIDDEFGR